MNEDMGIAGFTGRTRDEEKNELDTIVRYSRDHIRFDHDKVKVI